MGSKALRKRFREERNQADNMNRLNKLLRYSNPHPRVGKFDRSAFREFMDEIVAAFIPETLPEFIKTDDHQIKQWNGFRVRICQMLESHSLKCITANNDKN